MQAIRMMERGAEELARKKGIKSIEEFAKQAERDEKVWGRAICISAVALASVGVALILTSCGTNQPLGPQIAPEVNSHAASFDGSRQDSGIIGVSSGQFHVTPHFHDRYLAMASKYGSRFVPALDTGRGVQKQQDGTFTFDAEAMQDFLRMNQWRRNDAAATPAPSILKRVGL